MSDAFDPVEAALRTARTLKAGSWASVEALAMLAVELQPLPESRRLVSEARAAAQGLKPGTWESVRALAWLGRAEREIHASARPDPQS